MVFVGSAASHETHGQRWFWGKYFSQTQCWRGVSLTCVHADQHFPIQYLLQEFLFHINFSKLLNQEKPFLTHEFLGHEFFNIGCSSPADPIFPSAVSFAFHSFVFQQFLSRIFVTAEFLVIWIRQVVNFEHDRWSSSLSLILAAAATQIHLFCF